MDNQLHGMSTSSMATVNMAVGEASKSNKRPVIDGMDANDPSSTAVAQPIIRAHPSMTSTGVLAPLNTFDGTNIRVTVWIDEVEAHLRLYRRLFGTTDDWLDAQLAIKALKGSASSWLANHQERHELSESWAKLKCRLLIAFESSVTREDVLHELKQLRMVAGQEDKYFLDFEAIQAKYGRLTYHEKLPIIKEAMPAMAKFGWNPREDDLWDAVMADAKRRCIDARNAAKQISSNDNPFLPPTSSSNNNNQFNQSFIANSNNSNNNHHISANYNQFGRYHNNSYHQNHHHQNPYHYHHQQHHQHHPYHHHQHHSSAPYPPSRGRGYSGQHGRGGRGIGRGRYHGHHHGRVHYGQDQCHEDCPECLAMWQQWQQQQHYASVFASGNKGLPKYPVTVAGSVVQALLDTGASLSLISPLLARKLQLRLSPCHVTIHGISQTPVVASRMAKRVPLVVQGKTVHVDLVLANIAGQPLLIGRDWFNASGAGYFPATNSIVFGDNTKTSANSEAMVAEIYLAEDEDDLHDDLDTCIGKLSDITYSGTQKEKQRWQTLVQNNKQNFATSWSQLSQCTLKAESVIETDGAVVNLPPHKMSEAAIEFFEAEVQQMLAAGIVEKTSSAYNSPCVAPLKHDGSRRFACDYRGLNAVTHSRHAHFPVVEEALDRVAKGKVFSKFDLTKGFHQVRLTDEDAIKTAFSLPSGKYIFRRLPFGLKNAPAVFAEVVSPLFAHLKNVLVYVDDIIVYSDSVDKHQRHLQEVFDVCKRYGLKLNPKKSHIGATKMDVLGFSITHGSITITNSTLDKLDTMQVPKDNKGVQRFLGTVNQYKRFIPDHGRYTRPLSQLLTKGTKFQWGKEQQQACEYLISALAQKPVMATANSSLPFILYTDASDRAIGAVLAQAHPEGERVVHYWGRQLQPAETRYSATEKEGLAVVSAVKRFSYYLEGRKFQIVTDHQPLTFLFSKKMAENARIARWSLFLQQFDYSIHYRKGSEHHNVDWISRDCLFVNVAVEDDYLNEWYYDDKLMTFLRNKKEKYAINTTKKDKRRIDRLAAVMDQDDQGILWVITPKNGRVKVPRPEDRDAIVLAEHERGHWKDRTVLDQLQHRYYWPQMAKDVARCSSECQRCMVMNKPTRPAVHEALSPATPARVFDLVSMDLLLGLPTTPEGYNGLLVMIDQLSRYPAAYAIKNRSSEEITRQLNKFITDYDSPREVLSDNGSEFTSSHMEQFLEARGIKHRFSSPYNSTGNALVEKYNDTLQNLLRKFALERPTNWASWIGEALNAYRRRVHPILGHSPHWMVFGQSRHIDQGDGQTDPTELPMWRTEEELAQYIKQRVDHIESVQQGRAQAREAITQEQQRTARRRNTKAVIIPPLSIGSQVMKKNHHRTDKLAPVWEGPYLVAATGSNGTYYLKNAAGITLPRPVPITQLKTIASIKKGITKLLVEDITNVKMSPMNKTFYRCAITGSNGQIRWLEQEQIANERIIGQFLTRNIQRAAEAQQRSQQSKPIIVKIPARQSPTTAEQSNANAVMNQVQQQSGDEEEVRNSEEEINLAVAQPQLQSTTVSRNSKSIAQPASANVNQAITLQDNVFISSSDPEHPKGSNWKGKLKVIGEMCKIAFERLRPGRRGKMTGQA